MKVVIDKPQSCIYCPWLAHDYHYGAFKCGCSDNEFEISNYDLYSGADSPDERCPLTEYREEVRICLQEKADT